MKFQHLALVLTGLLCAMPAKAEELRAAEARRFIAGKQFAYTCFDGTTGSGRINADGSVAGYIRVSGSGPQRFVVLPAGTLKTSGDRYCASVRGLPFEPCFNLTRTSAVSWRGSISGFGFAYCDFQRPSARTNIHRPMRVHELRASVSADE